MSDTATISQSSISRDENHFYCIQAMTIQDISELPVMKKQCITCPFRTDERGRHPDERLVAKIQMHVLSQSSHICHHHRLVDKPESHLCRGARNYQLEMFYRMGLLSEPTDRCWSKTKRQ